MTWHWRPSANAALAAKPGMTCFKVCQAINSSHICASGLGQHWFRYWLVTYLAPSHYLSQCWVIIYWTLKKTSVKFQSKYKTFHSLNVSENIVWETAAILSRGRWVKHFRYGFTYHDTLLKIPDVISSQNSRHFRVCNLRASRLIITQLFQ